MSSVGQGSGDLSSSSQAITTERQVTTMSGRRLADVLALAAATRNVLAKSASIQLAAVSRAAVTSSLTKAVKRNFRGAHDSRRNTPKSTTAAPPAGHEDEVLLEGKDQDVFYDRSDAHSSPANPDPSHEFKVPQSDDSSEAVVTSEKHSKQYRPKGASPSKSSKPTNPIQDQFTRKYSTHTLARGSYSTQRPVPVQTASDTSEKSPLRKNIDEEVYYDTKAATKRNKAREPDHIPSEAASPPTPHDNLHDGLNSEYYYAAEPDEPAKKSVLPHFPRSDAKEIQNDPLGSPLDPARSTPPLRRSSSGNWSRRAERGVPTGYLARVHGGFINVECSEYGAVGAQALEDAWCCSKAGTNDQYSGYPSYLSVAGSDCGL
jgi:hypothetical protein